MGICKKKAPEKGRTVIESILHRIHFPGKFRFKVCSLVLVDDRFLCQFIDDGDNGRKFFGSNALVAKVTELLYRISHGAGVVTVLQTFLFITPDSLER